MTAQCKNNSVFVKLTVNKCVHVFALIILENVMAEDMLKSKMKRFSGQLSISTLGLVSMALMRPNKVETAAGPRLDIGLQFGSTSRLSLATFRGIGLT